MNYSPNWRTGLDLYPRTCPRLFPLAYPQKIAWHNLGYAASHKRENRLAEQPPTKIELITILPKRVRLLEAALSGDFATALGFLTRPDGLENILAITNSHRCRRLRQLVAASRFFPPIRR
jgi:hypothetical protein